MRDRPDAGRLLEQARRTLLQEVLDLLPANQRYSALMVANAMAIAARELEQGPTVAAEERAALAGFLGAEEGAEAARLERHLAEAIRAGRHDAAEPLHALLSASTTRRLQIGNPKALGGSKGR